MPSSDTLDPTTKAALRDAVTAALHDNRDWIREVVQEALLEAADAEARREADLREALARARQSYPSAPHGQA